MDVARGLGRLLSAAAMVAALLLLPGPALADTFAPPVLLDCQPAPPIEEAVRTSELVFVGTVTALGNGGRSATVQVEEVWRGAEIPATVTVFGGTDPAQPAEDDRTFETGVRYVFFPVEWEGRLVDHICTATTPWVDDLAAVRPAGVQTPLPTEGEPTPGPLSAITDLALPIATAVLIGGAALAVAVVVGRRRES
jgi:hypothetical protein